MNITLGDAVIISVLIHSAIFLPLFGGKIRMDAPYRRESMVVDYIRVKEPPSRLVETPKVEIPPSPRVEMKPAAGLVAAKVSAPFAKETAVDLAAKQARIMSTRDYANYYQLIRERIRQKLKDRYRSYYNEGDVCLIFVLRADGALVSSSVDPKISTSDKVLINTATQSLKEATPFAPFPKALALPQMSFTLSVSFKKQ